MTTKPLNCSKFCFKRQRRDPVSHTRPKKLCEPIFEAKFIKSDLHAKLIGPTTTMRRMTTVCGGAVPVGATLHASSASIRAQIEQLNTKFGFSSVMPRGSDYGQTRVNDMRKVAGVRLAWHGAAPPPDPAQCWR